MENKLALRPTYWASVSGGKDSLFMLKLILSNPQKYPLNGVVHFELEIDYPFIKDVIDYMENECKRFGIPFLRIKPRTSWYALYAKWGFPTRKRRWCNNPYKLDAFKQLQEYMKSIGLYVVSYIGYCLDESTRYIKRSGANVTECYPLVQEGIREETILEWAKEQPIFNNFYLTSKRCGCMYCPMSSMITFAYLYKYYPQRFGFMIARMKETEIEVEKRTGKPFSCISGNTKYNSDYLEQIVKTKWIHILNKKEIEEKRVKS